MKKLSMRSQCVPGSLSSPLPSVHAREPGDEAKCGHVAEWVYISKRNSRQQSKEITQENKG